MLTSRPSYTKRLKQLAVIVLPASRISWTWLMACAFCTKPCDCILCWEPSQTCQSRMNCFSESMSSQKRPLSVLIWWIYTETRSIGATGVESLIPRGSTIDSAAHLVGTRLWTENSKSLWKGHFLHLEKAQTLVWVGSIVSRAYDREKVCRGWVRNMSRKCGTELDNRHKGWMEWTTGMECTWCKCEVRDCTAGVEYPIGF